jgi:hypothetical protein
VEEVRHEAETLSEEHEGGLQRWVVEGDVLAVPCLAHHNVVLQKKEGSELLISACVEYASAGAAPAVKKVQQEAEKPSKKKEGGM